MYRQRENCCSIVWFHHTIIYIAFSPLVFEETDIVGQDGQIYKGRVTRRNKPLPPAARVSISVE